MSVPLKCCESTVGKVTRKEKTDHANMSQVNTLTEYQSSHRTDVQKEHQALPGHGERLEGISRSFWRARPAWEIVNFYCKNNST